MTSTSRGRVYTYRLRGCGRPLRWDDDGGYGSGLGTPSGMARLAGFSPVGALCFAKLNGWRYLGRDVAPDGEVLDWFSPPTGWAIALHTQSGDLGDLTEGVTVDLLPEPWVMADPWDPPFVGYILRFPRSDS
jgi:hypothetical protein